MNYPQKEKCAFTPAESEELDDEGDDAYSKKFSPITYESEQDVEEGEILDTDDLSCDLICSFYQSGKCFSGDKCRFLHVTDKGLYKMFDSPSINEFCTVYNDCAVQTDSGMFEETASSAWDRALLEAKKLVKERDLRAKITGKPVTTSIERGDEPKAARVKPRRYRSPEDFQRKTSLSDNLNDSDMGKSGEKQHVQHHDVKWHDPWRRSPVGYSKQSSVSPKFRRRKSSSSSSSRVSFKNKNRTWKKCSKHRYKVKSSRSLLRSCSPVSTEKSRKEKLKKYTEIQEEKVEKEKRKTPSVIKKLGECPKTVTRKKSPNVILASEKDSKLLCARQEKTSSPVVKTTERLMMNPTSFNTNTGRQLNASQGTPVKSCSDMSISPLSDASLSDQTGKMDRALLASWPRLLPFQKTSRIKESSPLSSAVPPEKEAVDSLQSKSKLTQNDRLRESMNPTEVKPKATVSNGTLVNKVVPKAVKKRFDNLECDLMKFQPNHRFKQPGSIHKNNVQLNSKKSTEGVGNCISKTGSHRVVCSSESHNIKTNKPPKPKETPRLLTRKEVLLKQLEAINAAIERKKQTL